MGTHSIHGEILTTFNNYVRNIADRNINSNNHSVVLKEIKMRNLWFRLKLVLGNWLSFEIGYSEDKHNEVKPTKHTLAQVKNQR